MIMSQLPEHHAEVGPGWEKILTDLHANLLVLVPEYAVTQIKEKFGGLRIYLTYPEGTDSSAPEALLDKAEEDSLRTCERCGKPGSPGGKYWVKTLCPEHRVADDKARAERWL